MSTPNGGLPRTIDALVITRSPLADESNSRRSARSSTGWSPLSAASCKLPEEAYCEKSPEPATQPPSLPEFRCGSGRGDRVSPRDEAARVGTGGTHASAGQGHEPSGHG